jgi:hypothetical protein
VGWWQLDVGTSARRPCASTGGCKASGPLAPAIEYVGTYCDNRYYSYAYADQDDDQSALGDQLAACSAAPRLSWQISFSEVATAGSDATQEISLDLPGVAIVPQDQTGIHRSEYAYAGSNSARHLDV